MKDQNAVTYRKLAPGEAPAYRELRLESLLKYPNSYGTNYEAQLQKPKMTYETQIEQRHPNNFVCGAFSAKDLVGICAFYRQEDPRRQHRGEIVQMYVKPEFQGQGIGLGLLQVCIQEAFTLPGMEQIELGVYAHNPAAIRVYEKVGFELYGRLNNCLNVEGGYVDELLMVLFP